MGRRQFIKLIIGGGAMSLLAACEDMPASAVAPWSGPDSGEADPRLRALSWALLAPNPHNLQAWVADVRTPGEISLHIDTTRLLPATDPFHRQILIGCGAFLELLCISASQDGHRAEIELMPEGAYAQAGIDRRPFARVRLHRDSGLRADPLFAAVRQRRTNRQAYAPTLPEPGVLHALAAAAVAPGIALGSTVAAVQVARINAMALEGYRIEFTKPETWQESARTLRIGAPETEAEPSGTALWGAEVWWGRQSGILSRTALLDPQGIGPKRALESLATVLGSGTSAWVWLSSADNSRAAQIEAGRSYLRVCLQATRLGLAMHPNSQVLQEFEEMQNLLAQVHTELGVPSPARIQMLARIGHAPNSAPAPRRPVSRLLQA